MRVFTSDFSSFIIWTLPSYFQIDDGNTNKVQNGVVRTNCMDNLDRTNVVQAALAKWTLNAQLRDLGILPSDASIDDYETFSKDYRESMYAC